LKTLLKILKNSVYFLLTIYIFVMQQEHSATELLRCRIITHHKWTLIHKERKFLFQNNWK